MMKTDRNTNNNNNNNNNNNSGDDVKSLPSFSDLLWCPDVDGEMMSEENINRQRKPGLPSHLSTFQPPNPDDPLADLNELELTGLVGSPCTPTPVKNAPDNNIPADISDLRSADLLQTIPGSIDIDKIFEDFHSEAPSKQPRKVIITRKTSAVSDLVSAVAHRATNFHTEENNNNVVVSLEEKENQQQQQQQQQQNYNNESCDISDSTTTSTSGFGGEPVVKSRRFLSPPSSNRYHLMTSTGANMYIAMERPLEEEKYKMKQKVGQRIESSISYLSSAFYEYVNDRNLTKNQFLKKVDDDVNNLAGLIVTSISDVNYDGDIEGWEYDWSFPNALLFTITIMTSIGYGHISPKTFIAQMFTIPYTLLGLGLLMIFLAKVGNVMASTLKMTYSRICCRCFRIQRKKTEEIVAAKQGLKTKILRLEDENVGTESYMPTDEIYLPVTLIIVTMFSYVFLGVALFSVWESWDWMAAFYFCIVSLTTIGFGDLVPSFETSTLVGKFKICVVVIYIVCGMSLISMCIVLMQEHTRSKAQQLAKSVGLSNDRNSSVETVHLQSRDLTFFDSSPSIKERKNTKEVENKV